MLALEDINARDFDTVIIAAADLQGRLYGRRVPQRRFAADPEEGVDICTCALAWDTGQNLGAEVPFGGFHTGWHDFRLVPDLGTLRPYPGSSRTAICLADAFDEAGNPVEIAPRAILRRQLERAEQLGYRVVLASELEFYLYKGTAQQARLKRFQDLQPTTLVRSDYSIVGQAVEEPFIASIRREMDAADIPVFACQAEFGYGQWEVNLEHSDALEMADRHVIYKAGVKEMAMRADLAVTFMPKPHAAEFGSSCHLHCSLWRGDAPAFAVPGSHELSGEGLHFVGGLMEHLSETALFYAPHVNSYKRNASDDVAGGVIAWGYDNRTVTVRVIGRSRSLHVEHRYAGADANPYLASAALIAAGLDGIERQRDPGPPVRGNAYECPDVQRAPRSLPDAIAAFEASPFVASTFGDEAVVHYGSIARAEWNSFLQAVTDWEIMTDFEAV